MQDKIKASIWWMGGPNCNVGVVVVKTMRGLKCYIGNACGEDKKLDEQTIAKIGMPVYSPIADAMFPQFKGQFIT